MKYTYKVLMLSKLLIFDANKQTNWFVEQCLDKNDTSSCFASMAISNGASQGTEKHVTKQRVQQQNDFYVRYFHFKISVKISYMKSFYHANI